MPPPHTTRREAASLKTEMLPQRGMKSLGGGQGLMKRASSPGVVGEGVPLPPALPHRL